MKSNDLRFLVLWSGLKVIVCLLLICIVLLLILVFKPAHSGETSSLPSPDNPTEIKKTEIALTPQQTKGKDLFEANCITCHAIDKVKVGPALSGISKRRSTEWIINFVHNSRKVIESGDPYARELFEKFNRTDMTAFPSFTNQEIESIISYVESGSTR